MRKRVANEQDVRAEVEYCCYPKCNMALGTAETRVAIDSERVMHQNCYSKHLRDLATRAAVRRTREGLTIN